MPIAFACPHCAKPFRVADELAGKRSKCPSCGNTLMVPASAAVQAPPPAPPPYVPPPAPVYAPPPAPVYAPPPPQPAYDVTGVPAAAPMAYQRPRAGSGKGKLVAILSLAVIGLGVVAAVGGGLVYYLVMGPTGPSGDDLRYLPNNCQAVLSLRPEQILASKAFQDVKKEMPNGSDKDLEKSMEKEMGIPMANITSLVIGGRFDGEADLAGIVHTNKAVTAADLLSNMKDAKFTEEKVGNYTMHKKNVTYGSKDCFCVVDSNLVVFCNNPDTLKKILERDKKAEMSEGMQAALNQIDTSKTLALAVNVKDALAKRKSQGSGMGMMAMMDPTQMVDFDDVEGLAVNMNIGNDIQVTATAVCKDKASAEDVRKLADGLIVIFKKVKAVPKDVQEMFATWDTASSGSKMTIKMTVKVEPMIKLAKESARPRTMTFQKVGSALSGPNQ
jgi:predicted Zn finger-like uncharacterized protein